MKKRIPFFLTALICCIFFSCSNQNQEDETSFLNFSFSESSLRAATSGASGDWYLKILLSGSLSIERNYPIKKESLQQTQTFYIENLPSGIALNIDSYVYCGNLCYFKSKATKSVVLSEGINSVDIVLARNISNGNFTVENPADIKISAQDSNGKEYSSSKEIQSLPYDNQITFSVDSDMDFNSYTWYLNGNELEEKSKKISLKLSENDFVETSKSGNTNNNSLVCIFIYEGKSYAAEFVFTTTAN